MSGIEIHGESLDCFLTISLKDIVPCLGDIFYLINWRLFSLEVWAIEDECNERLVNLEREVEESSNGITVDFGQINDIAQNSFQIINIILVGSKDLDNLYIDDDYRNKRNNYDYYIELLDSSYFVVYSYNEIFINCLKQNLKGVRAID